MEENTPLLMKKNENQKEVSKSNGFFSSIWAPRIYIIIAAIILFGSGVLVAISHKPKNKKFNIDYNWEKPTFVSLEKKLPVSPKWKYKRALHDNDEITVSLALKQQNVDKMHKILQDISNPLSKNYGKFKTYNEVHELVAPSDESINAVKSWLSYHGINEEDYDHNTPNSDFIKFTIDVNTANKMFNTEYSKWEHTDSKKEAVRVKDHYSVPDVLKEHLDFVSPSVRFPLNGRLKSIESIGEVDSFKKTESGAGDKADGVFRSSYYVYPEKLWSLYHVDTSYTPSSDASQCIASFLEEWYDDTDLQTFWTYFGVESSNVSRYPSYQPDGYGSEAELDVQYITSMGQGINTIVWDVEDDNYFLSLLEQMEKTDIIPSVVSMSYGGDEQSNGEEYCVRGNVEFGKVTLMGCTFFASSGDDGAVSSDGSLDENNMYTPSFPATSTYVVAVGGTYGGDIQESSDSQTNEIAWYNSGGGFSVFFNSEDYQSTIQSDYVSKMSSVLNENRFYSSGSGYPDVSAQSVAYVICYESGLYAVSGTSCSSPTVAGMFALINDQRVTAGKSKLGWLNPTLWQLGTKKHLEYFNDVTTGYNEGSDDDNGIAFTATEGWDPVTGWGTIKFDKLSTALLNIEDTMKAIEEETTNTNAQIKSIEGIDEDEYMNNNRNNDEKH